MGLWDSNVRNRHGPCCWISYHWYLVTLTFKLLYPSKTEYFTIGAFHEATGSHEIGFYFAGTMVIISSVLIFFLSRVKNKRKREEGGKIHICDEYCKKMQHLTFVLKSSTIMQLSSPSRGENKKEFNNHIDEALNKASG